jgi:hypothetical protein
MIGIGLEQLRRSGQNANVEHGRDRHLALPEDG